MKNNIEQDKKNTKKKKTCMVSFICVLLVQLLRCGDRKWDFIFWCFGDSDDDSDFAAWGLVIFCNVDVPVPVLNEALYVVDRHVDLFNPNPILIWLTISWCQLAVVTQIIIIWVLVFVIPKPTPVTNGRETSIHFRAGQVLFRSSWTWPTSLSNSAKNFSCIRMKFAGSVLREELTQQMSLW